MCIGKSTGIGKSNQHELMYKKAMTTFVRGVSFDKTIFNFKRTIADCNAHCSKSGKPLFLNLTKQK